MEGAFPAPPTTTTQQHEEIQRRADVASQMRGCDETASFDRVTEEPGDDPPFRQVDQQFVLFSLSHVAMPPIARDPTSPGIRFYGLFETRNDARAYAGEVAQADPTCSLLITPTHTWDVAAKSLDRHKDVVYKRQKHERIALAHATLRQAGAAEFRANVAQARTGSNDVPNEDSVVADEARAVRKALHETEWARKLQDGRRAPARLPGTLAIEGQRYMVVTFAKDVSPEVVAGDDDPEFAFMVLAAFDTEAQCNRYVRNVAAEVVQDHALDVVACRQWLHPEAVELEDNVGTVYRQKELTEVMQRKKQDVGEVARYKRDQERIGTPVVMTDIDVETPVDRPMPTRLPVADSDPATGPARITFEADLFGADEYAGSLVAEANELFAHAP